MPANYRQLANLPSHGNAAYANAGPATEKYTMGGQGYSCAIARPPPPMTYCTPAPFSSRYGQKFFNLSEAYGASVPMGY